MSNLLLPNKHTNNTVIVSILTYIIKHKYPLNLICYRLLVFEKPILTINDYRYNIG